MYLVLFQLGHNLCYFFLEDIDLSQVVGEAVISSILQMYHFIVME